MGLGMLVKRCTASLLPRSVMVHGSRAAGEVAITFDDGPHPEQTPRLLEALARKGVSATFFLQGDHASLWPHLVRDIHAAGHQVANHGFLHQHASQRPAQEFVQDVERAHAVLQDSVGSALARDFRPPYGDITPRTFMTLASKGYRAVFWTVDSDDSDIREPEALVSHVSALDVSSGDIVLFHEDYAHTVTAIPTIVDRLQERGLSLRRVDQLARR